MRGLGRLGFGGRGGSGLAAAAELASSDFKNGVYRLHGSTVALGGLWTQDVPNGWLFTGATISPGNGLGNVPATAEAPVAVPALLAAMNLRGAGCTIVATINVTAVPAATDAGGMKISFCPGAYPAAHEIAVWIESAADATGSFVLLGDLTTQEQNISRTLDNTGIKKIAINWSPTGIFMSVNGSVVYDRLDAQLVDTDGTWDTFAAYISGEAAGRTWIEKIQFYGRQPNSDLRSLST